MNFPETVVGNTNIHILTEIIHFLFLFIFGKLNTEMKNEIAVETKTVGAKNFDYKRHHIEMKITHDLLNYINVAPEKDEISQIETEYWQSDKF